MCNIRRETPPVPSVARVVEPPHVRRARVREHTRGSHVYDCVCICTCTYVPRTYVDVPVASVYISAAYTPKTSPLTPFAVVYRCSLFSCCRFLFFSRFSFPPAAHPPHDYPPISRSLVYSTGRLGTVLVTTFPGRSFGKRRIFSSALFLSCSLSLSPFFSRARRVPPFYFACLCREKDSRRGELSCRIQRDDRRKIERKRDRGDARRGIVGKKRDREGEREMIIHSAVITQSPAP